ncbi:hypothetical protein, partial [Aetokthonos hydrillicola]|uniref:hypothetical protein n=1 Tax=Aetokthonos hydrillicola TaxID=1550245 RepID=UPI001ABA771B
THPFSVTFRIVFNQFIQEIKHSLFTLIPEAKVVKWTLAKNVDLLTYNSSSSTNLIFKSL